MILVKNSALQKFTIIEAHPWFSHEEKRGSDFVGEIDSYNYPEKPRFFPYYTKDYALSHGIKWWGAV